MKCKSMLFLCVFLCDKSSMLSTTVLHPRSKQYNVILLLLSSFKTKISSSYDMIRYNPKHPQNQNVSM